MSHPLCIRGCAVTWVLQASCNIARGWDVGRSARFVGQDGTLNNLRSRLIVSHVAVVALAFVLLTLAAAVPVRRAQLRAEETRLRGVAGAVVVQAAIVQRVTSVDDSGLQALIAREARQSNSVLLLVNDDGTVVADSRAGAPAVGQRRPDLARRIANLRAGPAPEAGQALPLTRGESIGRLDRRLAALAITRDSAAPGQPSLAAVALSPERRVPVLAGVLRPLIFAGGLALLVGIVASVLLARSISQPLAQLTTAAGDINAGNLAARLPEAGDDEVAGLARAFNATLERLAATYAAQRALLANIAHELRTPLTSIQGYTQALRDGTASAPTAQAAALHVIDEEAQRMSALVNQVLQLSRLESGQLDMHPAPVALVPLLDQLRRVVLPQAQDGAVTVTVTAPPELALTADAELLTQALSNLVTNALRHTPPGGSVSISASAFVANNGARHARIAVSDTGAGIPPDELAHIFERFQRGADAAGDARGPRRFGLGLAITREIARQHGGTLTVASAPGAGTTFALHLPGVLGVADDEPAR
jgi:signal transduction histidine kinase